MSCAYNKELTGCWLVAVVSMSEVLRILHHWNTSHPYDNCIRTCIQSTGGNDTMVDMMKRTGRVFLTTDHSYWTWRKDRRMMTYLKCETGVKMNISDCIVTQYW